MCCVSHQSICFDIIGINCIPLPPPRMFPVWSPQKLLQGKWQTSCERQTDTDVSVIVTFYLHPWWVRLSVSLNCVWGSPGYVSLGTSPHRPRFAPSTQKAEPPAGDGWLRVWVLPPPNEQVVTPAWWTCVSTDEMRVHLGWKRRRRSLFIILESWCTLCWHHPSRSLPVAALCFWVSFWALLLDVADNRS